MWEEDREMKVRNLNSLSHLLFVVVVDLKMSDVRKLACTVRVAKVIYLSKDFLSFPFFVRFGFVSPKRKAA